MWIWMLFSEVVELKGVLTGQVWALWQNLANNLQNVILCFIKKCQAMCLWLGEKQYSVEKA